LKNIDVNIYSRRQRWKYGLFVFALVIGISSLWYTNNLVKSLSMEERKNMELLAEATRQLARPNITNENLGFLLKIIQGNETVPVILTDSKGLIISTRNWDLEKVKNPLYLKTQLAHLAKEQQPIVIDLGNNEKNYIYYKESIILMKLQYFPFIQLAVIFLFVIVSYFAFSSSRKAEQNKVWVGLSKETAHQLGTPTSSLLAWVELLRSNETMDQAIVTELEKDVNRLQKIADRFSKIGSKPRLTPENLAEVLQNTIDYVGSRYSKKVTIKLLMPDQEAVILPLNVSLFDWVIENLCKNAIDAIEGTGIITLKVIEMAKTVYIDITDTGKGMVKSSYKTVFKPGYTTKQRGWGLGLSLSKRIIEEYHEGRIFVLKSELEKGTTFRIVLKKTL
jgi:nitrogen-specific signal transduction histidine kinase